MNTPAGVPVGAVTQAFAALGEDIQICRLLMRKSNKRTGDYNIWTKYRILQILIQVLISRSTTIAQPNFLAVREDISEEDVYQLTKAIYENLPFTTRYPQSNQSNGSRERIMSLPVPLHPGAARYYQEVGIDVPSELIVN
ncbi:TAXI family TRAP transporter solute-binding subunit [Vibrio lentus]|nr:TAXI family TRAP transporter solute-binding subunit [Vibrio lentus]